MSFEAHDRASMRASSDLDPKVQKLRDELWNSASKHVVRHAGDYDPYLICKAKGSWIWDDSGRPILDFVSGQICSTVGHNNPEIIQTIEDCCRNKAIHLFSWALSPSVIEFCSALSDMLPDGLDMVLPLSTGGESNEAALRSAKLTTGRWEVVGLNASWHGCTGGAAANTYAGARRGYGPVQPGTLTIPAPDSYRCPIRHCDGECDMTCLDFGFEEVDKQSVGALAACIAEPIISAGGMITPPKDYFKRLKQKCEEREMVLIYDEAQTGMARTGKNFAFEHFEQPPDILTLSKTLSGGIPISATVMSREMEQALFDRGFVHVTSHVCDPLPAAVALTVIKIILRDKLAERAKKMGNYLRKGLEKLHQSYEELGDLRGMGLLQGVQIVKDRNTKEPDPEFGRAVTVRCLELGLGMNIVSMKGMASVWRLAPPLTVTESEIDLALEILDEAILDVRNVTARH